MFLPAFHTTRLLWIFGDPLSARSCTGRIHHTILTFSAFLVSPAAAFAFLGGPLAFICGNTGFLFPLFAPKLLHTFTPDNDPVPIYQVFHMVQFGDTLGAKASVAFLFLPFLQAFKLPLLQSFLVGVGL